MSTPAPILRARRIAGGLLLAAFIAIVIALVLALNGWFTRTPTLDGAPPLLVPGVQATSVACAGPARI